ncbi:MAG: 2-iminoacetate synthase ThiH [Chlamydiae bacterium]|nr:2-iminoacetate synthase ThiH [Chlamydiota bacterium]MBI3276677.1 2-iminoacetate synthase ThiH [Chlamydiota bacterium]
MSFASILEKLPLDLFVKILQETTPEKVKQSLNAPIKKIEDFIHLISPAATQSLEKMAQASHELTLQRFGRIIQFYAPLYVSNECVDTCTYCGFNRENEIVRLTLKPLEVLKEARFLMKQGFRHLLLVSGEHPRSTPPEYIAEVTRLLHKEVSSLSLELAPQTEEIYRQWVLAGADGLVVYQETYQKDMYAQVHLAGKKKNFLWRLETPERGAAAGMKRLGIGALLGLSDWRKDAIALVTHAQYLLKTCWRSSLTISIPRIRPAVGGFTPEYFISDREFTQLICALRLCLPDVGIVLSTREHPKLRNGLISLGVTQISAGSRTEPGGYENPNAAGEQFEIEDTRSPQEMAETVRKLGYEAVWKDWDGALN